MGQQATNPDKYVPVAFGKRCTEEAVRPLMS